MFGFRKYIRDYCLLNRIFHDFSCNSENADLANRKNDDNVILVKTTISFLPKTFVYENATKRDIWKKQMSEKRYWVSIFQK